MNLETKYQRAVVQYEKLTPTQKMIFDALRNRYKDYKDKKVKERREMQKKQELAKEEKKKSLMKLIEDYDKPEDPNLPLEKQKDTLKKFKAIQQKYSVNNPYTDPNFPATSASIGEKVLKRIPGVKITWKRAEPNSQLFSQDGYDANDVVQGKIGDCYFLSAISIVGLPYIKKCLANDKKIDQIKKQCGAYLVRFIISRKTIYVIIDNQFPVDDKGKWAFGHSDNPKTLWVNVFEKAYAKLFGGYQNIVSGKVSYSLSHLTGGYPEELNLKQEQRNLQKLWKTIHLYSQQGYKLGVGSPPNPRGDAAVSEDGIVQGHAYAILRVIETNDDDQLVNLRNPHGMTGIEWRGDWKDNGSDWTKSIINRYKIVFGSDGAFWMSLDDFADEFLTLYVCRIFTPQKWKKNPRPITGEWKGTSSQGMPAKNNPDCTLKFNPQYFIKVNQKCTVFISLTQNEQENIYTGKQPIVFLLYKNNGKRIGHISSENSVGTSGSPIVNKTISKQFNLQAPYYPYTFTLMTASYYPGEKGEGTYSLDVYCTDKRFKIGSF